MTAMAKTLDLDFAPPPELVALADKVKNFVIEQVIPYERDPRWTAHGPTDALRLELNDLARKAGVFAPHVPEEFGGRALSFIGHALVFEAAGYSMLGPMAIHCASPDEGNIHLLDVVARPDQRAHFLKRCCRPRRGSTATNGC
jgi:alkylation response protein AidB-like acyl-CoA dehydrogenase